jgi:hypothetical protein
VTPPAEWAGDICAGAPLGTRNVTCARLAGHLLARGIDPAVALALLEAWDERRNRPPMGSREVERVATSIARREASQLRRRLR